MGGASRYQVVIVAHILDKTPVITDDGGTCYRYTGTYWKVMSDQALDRLARVHDEMPSTTSRRREIIAYLKAETFLEDHEWGRVEDYEIPCENTVVDVDGRNMRPHRQADYLERVIPWPYRPGAECPVWMKCLGTWFGAADSEEARALQMFFGYIVMPYARLKRAAILVGPRDSGKSAAIKVAEFLVGEQNCCSLGVDDMDDPQRRSILKGKALNTLTELSSRAMIADGGFKTLVSTEERIFLDAKYKPVESYRSTAKHLIGANRLPMVTDGTAATVRRLLVIPFKISLAEADQDAALGDKLKAEMPGILIWAIQGAALLRAAGGRFLEPLSGQNLLDEAREDAAPIRQFLFECCDPIDGYAVPLREVLRRFNHWREGRYRVGIREIGRMLREDGQIVKNVRHGRFVHKSLCGHTMSSETDMPTVLRYDSHQDLGGSGEISSINTLPSDKPGGGENEGVDGVD